MTRAVPPADSLADMLAAGELHKLPRERLDSLIAAAVSVVVRLQRARFSWRSMKPKHFYPEQTVDSDWRIWLIDCEGVHSRASEHSSRREWRAFLQRIEALAPDLVDAFVAAYRLETT